jgi:hypothetical protein
MVRKILQFQPWLALVALVSLVAGAPAAAQTYGIGAGTANFGYVASAASGDTQFTINASTGQVVRDSGLGGRISTGAAYATVTINCTGSNQCNSKNVNVRVALNGSPTGRIVAPTGFNVASGTATVSNVNTSTPTNITFTLAPIPRDQSRTFILGMTFKVRGDNSGSAVGSAAAGYYVSAIAANSTPPSSGTPGQLTATVYRSLSVVKNSELTFGRIVRPLTGSGAITLNSNGTRSATNAIWMASPFPIRASYTATGEGGKVLSINVDPTFTMNKQGGPACPVPADCKLVVTTNNSIVGTPTLGTGASGTYFFLVGGSFPITSTTASGSYTGTFNVNVAYN